MEGNLKMADTVRAKTEVSKNKREDDELKVLETNKIQKLMKKMEFKYSQTS